MYESLSAEKILETLERLTRRIQERFPGAGLASVSGELTRIASEVARQTQELGRPHLPLRAGVGVLLAGVVVVLAVFVPELRVNVRIREMSDLVQTIEAFLGSLFFLGTGIAFLITFESRLKRRRALKLVHELRSVAHVVDMHQLTKDPEGLLGPRTPSSPVRAMSDQELLRYLDYCSELFALISKVGALTVQGYGDPVVLAAVDEVESLTTGLSRKVWQKITLVHQMVEDQRRAQARRPSLMALRTRGA
ncbi:MAG: hypothetical protein KF718_24500 [Polyangiaceae bacterium]|nr:hypothetical protein [Polyangiaceae bacterium]